MADQDTTPPVLVSIDLPKTINVTKGDQNATFSVGATDRGLGVSSVQLHLDHTIQYNGQAMSFLYLSDAWDSFADGKSTATQKIDSATGAGTYNVDYAVVYDKANNATYYTSTQLAALGVDTHFTVKSSTVADTTGPTLTAIDLPKTINVTKGDQNAVFTVGAIDKGLGVSSVDLHLDHAIQHAGLGTNFLSFYEAVDSFADGRSTMTEEIDGTTGAGTYDVDYAVVHDKAGNSTTYTTSQLAALGVETHFTVKSNTVTDTTGPTLTAIDLPKTINLTKGDQNATFTVGATDRGLGVSSVELHLDHTIQHAGRADGYLIFFDGNDSFADGKSTLTEQIDSTTGVGTYNVDFALVHDKAGNSTYYDAGQLAALGVETRFTVKNASAAAQADMPYPSLSDHPWYAPESHSLPALFA